MQYPILQNAIKHRNEANAWQANKRKIQHTPENQLLSFRHIRENSGKYQVPKNPAQNITPCPETQTNSFVIARLSPKMCDAQQKASPNKWQSKSTQTYHYNGYKCPLLFAIQYFVQTLILQLITQRASILKQ